MDKYLAAQGRAIWRVPSATKEQGRDKKKQKEGKREQETKAHLSRTADILRGLEGPELAAASTVSEVY